ncbi:MAG TPA: hypothetical protein VMV36_09085 [Ignavibacteriaceae bacterium]|nr:hypothetical protein [Ignavibacteriaceae bacterium]
MKNYRIEFLIILLSAIFLAFPTSIKSQNKWLILKPGDISANYHNLDHFKIFSKYSRSYNLEVLRAIDTVQAHAMDGGGYFIGIDSTPTESPIGYDLKLFGNSLITPPRSSSYCSGSTYSVLITSLDFILGKSSRNISKDRLEAMRMQEPNGGRRDDWIKYWGIWNADGFGSEYALVQYSKMGVEVKPEDAIPGDFMNISWKSGIGHSVIFLGWYLDKNGDKCVAYWSSQKGTNGFGDQIVSLKKIKSLKIVRLTKPQNIFKFNISKKVNTNVAGDMPTF